MALHVVIWGTAWCIICTLACSLVNGVIKKKVRSVESSGDQRRVRLKERGNRKGDHKFRMCKMDKYDTGTFISCSANTGAERRMYFVGG